MMGANLAFSGLGEQIAYASLFSAAALMASAAVNGP